MRSVKQTFSGLFTGEFRESLFNFLFRKFGLNKKILLLFAAAIAGALVSGISILLHTVIYELSALTYLNRDLADFIWLIPGAGGLLTGLIVYAVLKEEQGGGVEETVKNIQLKTRVTGLRHVLLRFITSALTLGTGGSAGKEGPVVHLGSGIGSILGRVLRFPVSYRKTLMGSGVAAGIAAAFQAPIAGAFFALEILLADFTLDTFSMIVVASITATAFSQSFGHIDANIIAPHYTFEDPAELIFFAILGILGGLVNVAFTGSLFMGNNFFKKSRLPVWLKPAVGGLLLGFLSLAFPFVLGEGYDVMNLLLSGDFGSINRILPESTIFGTTAILLLILSVKILATSLTLSSGGSGGTIIPALFIGTTLGSIMAHVTTVIFPGFVFSEGTWVLAGMASVLAPMTQAPLFSITLFFELTRDYEVILPVLLVVTVSMLVSKHFIHGSLYSIALQKEGFRLYRGMEESIMEQFDVKEVMHRNINLIKKDANLGSIIENFLHSPYTAGFVIDEQQRYKGIISLADTREYINRHELYETVCADDLASGSDFWLSPDQNLLQALELMETTDMAWLPVLDGIKRGRPVGFITRKDIISIYNREVIKRGSRNIMIEGRENESERHLNLSEGYQIETIEIGRAWQGKTLKDLNLRADYNLTVIGIKLVDDYGNIIPDVNYRLKQGDRLTLVGMADDIKKISEIENNRDEKQKN